MLCPHLPVRPDTKPITRPVVLCQGTLSRLDTVLPAVVILEAGVAAPDTFTDIAVEHRFDRACTPRYM